MSVSTGMHPARIPTKLLNGRDRSWGGSVPFSSVSDNVPLPQTRNRVLMMAFPPVGARIPQISESLAFPSFCV